MRGLAALFVAGSALTISLACCTEESDTRDRFEATATNATSSAAGGSNGTGVGPGAGGSGASSTSSATASGGAEPCPNTDQEPNDTEATAIDKGTIDECDPATPLTVSGTLAGNDVDWYVYYGMDTFSLCQIDATRSITSDGQARVCKYIDCVNPSFTCPMGSTADTSPSLALPGCCSLSAFSFYADCDGSDDSAYVYLRVDKPQALACVNYTLTYHF